MRLLDRLTIRLSWSLVLIAFGAIILGTGALGLYANHHGRTAFADLREVQEQQSRALHQAYIATLRTQVAMERAAHLLRVPSFDRPGPIVDQARADMDAAEAAFERFQAMAEGETAEALGERFHSLLGTGLSLQLMLLEEEDLGGYDAGKARLAQLSQAFMDGAEAFFEASTTRGDAQAERFNAMASWLNLALVAALAGALALVLVVVWGVRVNVIRPWHASPRIFGASPTVISPRRWRPAAATRSASSMPSSTACAGPWPRPSSASATAAARYGRRRRA